MAKADDWQRRPQRGELPDEPWAQLAQQSQLDFELGFFESVLRRSPSYVDVLRCQGELLSRKGMHARALDVDRRLVRLLPNDCVVRYNLACSLAVMGLLPEAVAALRASLERGYDDFEHLESDADLDGLRDDPAYLALMREYGLPAS